MIKMLKNNYVLIIGTIIIMTGMFIVVLSVKGATAETIIVDDDGGADYEKIQDAVDNATENDTIRVYAGNYEESIFIDKPLNLIGNGTENTTIDAKWKGNVINISANFVNISEFFIRGSSYNDEDAGIKIYTSNNIISNCNITYNGRIGIHLHNSTGNTISNCNISNNYWAGIYISDLSTNNNISKCNLNDNGYGILLYNSTNNTVSSCNISDNNDEGIFFWNSSNNIIKNNTFIEDGTGFDGQILSHFIQIIENNTVNGESLLYYKNEENIDLNGINVGEIIFANCSNSKIKNINISNTDNGIEFAFSRYNNISDCNISNNDMRGIYFYESNNNTILNCNISTNRMYGIELIDSDNITISDCNLSENGRYSIWFEKSNNNTISYSNFSHNDNNIWIEQSNYNLISGCFIFKNNHGITTIDSFKNTISDCDITDNYNYGIYFADSNNNKITYCDILYNEEYGIWFERSCNNSISQCNISNSDRGIYIRPYSDNINISGCTIKDNYMGIDITGSDNDIIRDCNIKNNEYGLYITGSSTFNNTILKCVISNNRKGIYIHGSSKNNITICNIYSNTDGIYFSSSDNMIYNCSVSNNKYGIHFSSARYNKIINCNINGNEYGIWLEKSSNYNEISNCIINNNDKYYGIYFYDSCNNNTIINCNISSNWYGISFSDFCNENMISGCNISNNDIDGIKLYKSSNNTIINCIYINNTIYLHSSTINKILSCNGGGIGLSHSSNQNIVLSCNISNGGIGLSYSSNQNIIKWCNISKGAISLRLSTNNTISNCNISNNNNYGMELDESSNNNIIRNCNISNNTGSGIRFENSCINNTITNCNIIKNYAGVRFEDNNDNNTVSNCNIINNSYNGIWLDFYNNNNKFINLTILSNNNGLYFQHNNDNNKITNCVISNNVMTGIYIEDSSNFNTIIDSNISNNNKNGLYIEDSSDFNTIQDCNIFYNEGRGIYLWESSNNTICNNTFVDNEIRFWGKLLSYYIHTIENNTLDGKPLLYYKNLNNSILNGIEFKQIIIVNCSNFEIKNINISNLYAGLICAFCKNINITNCNISHNKYYGIIFIGCINNKISDCIITDNVYNGIYLRDSCKNNIISKCDISYNNGAGIGLGDSNENSISNCNIYNNTNYGVYIRESSKNKFINCNISNNFVDGIFLNDKSDFNTISSSEICNNSDDGISLEYSSKNIILNCNISKNNHSINLYDRSNDNIIYYNNVINNNQSANDECSNNWDYDKIGNYWDDYNGKDDDGDGIGEKPYNISGGSNKDRYPLIYPWGTNDMVPPGIKNVRAFPDPQAIGEYVNISCDVTDNVIVYKVKINITYPDDSTENITMSKGSHYYNTTFNQIGTYKYFIWVRDVKNNINTSSIYTFVIKEVPNIIYVDDDFNKNTQGWEYDHFNKILDGIDSISENGIIYVYNGTYYEKPIIYKSLKLIGNSSTDTIIDGRGEGIVIEIKSDNVEMSNFLIMGSGDDEDVGIKVYSHKNIISKCVISNNDMAGIRFIKSTNNTISESNILNNNKYGIWLDDSCNNNKILGCIISNNEEGIYLRYSNNNLISSCNISNNEEGISLRESRNNTISFCNISNNIDYSIKIRFSSNKNSMFYNNFYDNARDDCINNWDNGKRGNYWDDYDGTDTDGDGIGETPYEISGGNNKDNYPLVLPSGNKDTEPPDANAGDNQKVQQGTEVLLDAINSNDNVGIINWTWSFTYNEIVQTFYGETVEFTFSIVGEYEIKLTVKDAVDLSDSDIVLVNVIDIYPPKADAGNNVEVPQGTEITFDGSNSSDNIGIVNWIWNFIYDETSHELNGEKPKFTFWEAGNYEITLTVNDAVDLSDTDIILIKVTDITPPTATISKNQAVPQGSEVTFNGSNSLDNVGIINWTWNFIYNETSVTLYGEVVNFTFWTAGDYEITLDVLDAVGLLDINKVWIKIIDITPPIAEAGSNKEVLQGTEVLFDGSNSTDNEGIVNWTWNFTYNDAFNEIFGEKTKFIFWTVGNYEITLTVKDSGNLSAMDKIWINITDNTPPVADAGIDRKITPGMEIIFDCSNSTDNVGIIYWTWTFKDIDLKTLFGINTNYTFNNIGNYLITLTVKDSVGLIDTDTMWVNVTKEEIETNNCTITGIVKDEKGNPIINALVELFNTTYSTTTDENGIYSFKNIPSGTYKISVKKEGYLESTETISVEDGKTINSDIILNEESRTKKDENAKKIILIIPIVIIVGVIGFMIYQKKGKKRN